MLTCWLCAGVPCACNPMRLRCRYCLSILQKYGDCACFKRSKTQKCACKRCYAMHKMASSFHHAAPQWYARALAGADTRTESQKALWASADSAVAGMCCPTVERGATLGLTQYVPAEARARATLLFGGCVHARSLNSFLHITTQPEAHATMARVRSTVRRTAKVARAYACACAWCGMHTRKTKMEPQAADAADAHRRSARAGTTR